MPAVDRTAYLAVDSALAELGIQVYQPEDSDIFVGPQATAIHLSPMAGVRVDKIARSLQTLKLRLGVTGDLSLSTYEQPGKVTLFVPHSKRTAAPLTAFLSLSEMGDRLLPFPVGITADNRTLWADLAQTNHLLIAGSTGSGKTIYLQGVVAGLCFSQSPSDLELYLVDPKRLDFAVLSELPHVAGRVMSTAEETLDLLRRLARTEVPRRQKIISDAGLRNLKEYRNASPTPAGLPYTVVIIDEYGELSLSLDKEARTELEDLVCRLAAIGRALGIYVILATQRPSVDIISGKIKANFPTRISFRLPSHGDSQVVLGEPGAESLLPGGDGLLVGAGPMRRFQALYVDDAEIRKVLSAVTESGSN